MPDVATHYDPSAGPWAIAMSNELTGYKLQDGSTLKITVFPATVEKEIPREVKGLQCDFVVQIWHTHVSDASGSPGGVSSGDNFSPLNPLQAGPGPINSEDSLYFSLWNVTTGKVLSTGSAAIHRRASIEAPNIPPGLPCTAFALQAIKRLNQRR